MVLLARNWWAFVLRGVLAILFGLMVILLPGMALMTLVVLFGFFAIAEGVFSLMAAFRTTPTLQHQPWWALLLEGLIGIAAGLAALFWPGLTAIVLLYIIAAWAVVSGILEIVAAIRIRRHVSGEWLLGLAGALSVVFGVLVAMFPGAGALVMVLWIGAYAIVFGVLLIGLGIQLRRMARAVERQVGEGFPGVAPGH